MLHFLAGESASGNMLVFATVAHDAGYIPDMITIISVLKRCYIMWKYNAAYYVRVCWTASRLLFFRGFLLLLNYQWYLSQIANSVGWAWWRLFEVKMLDRNNKSIISSWPARAQDEHTSEATVGHLLSAWGPCPVERLLPHLRCICLTEQPRWVSHPSPAFQSIQTLRSLLGWLLTQNLTVCLILMEKLWSDEVLTNDVTEQL